MFELKVVELKGLLSLFPFVRPVLLWIDEVRRDLSDKHKHTLRIPTCIMRSTATTWGTQVCNSLMGGSKNTHTVHKEKTFHSSFQNTTRTSLIFSVGEGRSDRSEHRNIVFTYLYLFYSLYN